MTLNTCVKKHLQWWELLCGETVSAIQSPSDGLGCDKLPAHMVLSLSHLALLCLSLQAQTPSAYPHSIPPHCQSHHTPPSSPFLYPSLIWTIRAKTGEASFFRTHPTSSLSFSVIYFPTPSLHSSISVPSHADNPSGLVVDGGVNSALWWCLKGSGSIWLSSGWLSPCLLVMEPF